MDSNLQRKKKRNYKHPLSQLSVLPPIKDGPGRAIIDIRELKQFVFSHHSDKTAWQHPPYHQISRILIFDLSDSFLTLSISIEINISMACKYDSWSQISQVTKEI